MPIKAALTENAAHIRERRRIIDANRRCPNTRAAKITPAPKTPASQSAGMKGNKNSSHSAIALTAKNATIAKLAIVTCSKKWKRLKITRPANVHNPAQRKSVANVTKGSLTIPATVTRSTEPRNPSKHNKAKTSSPANAAT